MAEEDTKKSEELKTTERSKLANKLSTAGWGLFFIWIGIVLLMKLDTGIGLLGVGIITLGMQAARKYFNLNLEGFWVVVGLFFVVGGLWELFEAKLPLFPFLLIVVGLALLVSIVRGKHLIRK
ncbi:MAG: hypothetical protein GTN74_05820 [Proteobacteria bacterium]|nr:hypothetical protein [Pseudomonadota bacterium]